jgi:SpoIID/LytB domain protein
MRARRLASVLVVTLAIAGFGLQAATPASATLEGNVEFSGHGWGHGRGMSQWGARGYAVDHGWSSQRILDHYYRGTAAASVGNPGIGVELMALAGRPLIVTSPALKVDGTAVGTAAVRVERNSNGTFKVLRGSGCGGPWSGWRDGVGSRLVIASNATADPATHVQVCEATRIRGYRGDLQVVDTGSRSAVVNRLLLEDYLRGVVPREMPASWADLGGGKGAHALRSQAVAARSYAISSPRNSYSTTCDTIACQVYGGEYTRPHGSTVRTSLEDPRSDAAIRATAGVVRMASGRVSRTEFSSSSGGWTAGGTFPSVPDAGDGTAGNPNHNWSQAIDARTLAAQLGTPPITGMSITERNGLGADGGRVRQIVVETTGGSRTFTGAEFRSRTGLKSDWFKVGVRSYAQAVSYTRALYTDLLGRTPSNSEVAAWAGTIAGGTAPGTVARTFLTSTERLRVTVAGVYADALNRAPDEGGYRSWVAYLRSGATFNDLNAALYGSPESLQRLGGGDVRRWVEGLYQGLLNRSAGASERAYWADVARVRGRGYVAWNISASTEARKLRLYGYYTALLQRPVDSSGLRTWMPRMMQDGDIQVQVFIASSTEYWNRARTRFP